ncbi:MAG: hypothetical protein IJE01_03505 [Clostridia bacterium]|nr:hypothetical protein [Clostridia bacterium]
MTKNLRLALISLAITLTIFSAVFAITASAKEQKTSITSVPQAEFYIIKTHNGQPAIFKGNSSSPILELDVFTDQLPDRDKDRLSRGIIVNSLEEAIRLAEDYE